MPRQIGASTTIEVPRVDGRALLSFDNGTSVSQFELRLLDALADDFVKAGFDRRHTLRLILNSRTYQLSSTANEFKTLSRYLRSAGL